MRWPGPTDSRSASSKVRCPPAADPAYGHFANEGRWLSAEEKHTLLAWINSARAKGDAVDQPPLPAASDDWAIGTPDRIVPLPEPIQVPASGIVEYITVELDPGFTTDTWIRAAEVMPATAASCTMPRWW